MPSRLALFVACRLRLLVWLVLGLLIYFGYSRRRSYVGRGIVEVPELAPEAPGIAIAPMPGAPVPPHDRG